MSYYRKLKAPTIKAVHLGYPYQFILSSKEKYMISLEEAIKMMGIM